jgi:hypothetical protein
MKAKRNITTASKSIIKKLKDQNKVDDSILTHINNLSIEDLIAVKLELASAHMNSRLYGFDIWKQSNNIVKEALLKFAISTTKSKKDAARFLGLTYIEFKRVSSKYDVDSFFTEDI